MKQPNNPPAFPTELPKGDGGFTLSKCEQDESRKGMTLRDYFAAKALCGQIQFEGMEGCSKYDIAAMCYELADAMLKQREL